MWEEWFTEAAGSGLLAPNARGAGRGDKGQQDAAAAG